MGSALAAEYATYFHDRIASSDTTAWSAVET